MPRTLPPVYSPLSAAALWRGLRAASSAVAAAAAERALREDLRTRGYAGQVLLTDSGTSALAIALGLAARGQPIALPAYGCFDLATAVDAAGVPFLLYDVNPTTLAPATGSVESAVSAGAAAVVVAHLYGLPVDIPFLRALIPADVAVIDDAAQGVGASIGGQPLGALGDFGVLSFGRGKGLTGGGGGALLLPESKEAPLLPPADGGTLRALIATAAQWVVARPGLYALPRALPFLGLGETHYRPPQEARAIGAFALGVLSASVQYIREEAERRRRVASAYRAALAGHPAISLPADIAEAGWLRFPVLLNASALGQARAEASLRLGIMPGYASSLADLEGFGERRLNGHASFPGARTLAQRLFTLPTHGALATKDVRAVIAHVQGFR